MTSRQAATRQAATRQAATRQAATWQGQPAGLLLPFAALCFSFGTTFGYLGTGVSIILRERGIALAQIGFLQLIYLPLGLTFLWAVVLDRTKLPVLPHRVGWIALTQGASTALLLLVSQGDAWPVAMLFCLALAISFAVATMDIALESLAVETVPAAQRPLVTTTKLFGASLGSIVGTGFLTIFYHRLGWQASLLALAGLNGCCLLPMLRYPEAALRRAETLSSPAASRPSRLKRLASHVLVVGLYFTASSLLLNETSLVLLDLHLSLVDVGIVVGTLGPLINLAMTLAAGALMLRYTAARLVTVMASGVAASGALLALAAALASARLGVAAVLLGSLAASGLGVPVFTMIYRWSQGTTAANDYALLFGASFLAALPARVGAPALAGALGWSRYFLAATLFYVAAFVLLGAAMRRTEREGSPS